ncbi:MAG: hypothetical protein NDP23_05250 [Crenarchaeota archaeon]|nr:hypothetical protein [Thermoproteota archaeon]
MREVIRNFEEFKERINRAKPMHHSGTIIAKGDFIHRLVFRIYAIDKDNGHVIIYETQKASPFADAEQLQDEYRRLVEKYAKPLGSTEGAWIQ